MTLHRPEFVKILTKTDVGKRGADGRKSNQSGVAVPKSAIGTMPALDGEQLNPSADFTATDDSGVRLDLRFIYFNGKVHGVNSRNEYRITGVGPYLRDRNADVGDRLSLTQVGDSAYRMRLDSQSSDGQSIPRSREMWTVALYMSRFGNVTGPGVSPLPPTRLGVGTWNEAYDAFYESCSDGRSLASFRASLKNARDLFDGHVAESGRTGWRQEDDGRTPQPLALLAQEIHERWGQASEAELWQEIRVLSSVSYRWQAEISDTDADDESSSPVDDDPFERVNRGIRLRRGQTALRNTLMRLYARACAISGVKGGVKTYRCAGVKVGHPRRRDERPDSGLMERGLTCGGLCRRGSETKAVAAPWSV